MNERLIAFLQAEQLSPARFADIMQIQRSGVSHLLSGRNKPGYDFFDKFLQKFPAINMEWLISGRGKMYKEQLITNSPTPVPAAAPPSVQDTPDLFSSIKEGIKEDMPLLPPVISTNSHQSSYKEEERHIEKLIILYSDGTFEERS